MIEINDKSIVQFVYFPKSNKTNSASYDVEIHSELTQITESFTGLTNESNSNTYYKFKVDFSKVLDGEYNYSIKDSENNVVSTGLIRIGEINNSMPEGASYDVVDEVIQYNPYGGFKWRFQDNKEIEVVENDTYVITPDEGYDALLKATVTVNIPVQDYYNSGYTSGFTDGYTSGYTDGVEEQKSKLVSTAVTENGVYSRVDGFSSIDVNVPSGSTINNQTKNVTYTANTATTITFDNGYTGLQQVGINVNVPQTGYTQEDLNNAFSNGFNSGFTSGQTVGYNSGYTAGYASGSTDGYDAGYIAGYADGYEEGSHDYEKEYLTITSLSGGSIVFKDIYSNSGLDFSYSINGGEWQTITSSQSGTSLAVQANDVVRLKASNSSYNNHYLQVTSAATVEGNIMSMFYGDDFYGEKDFTAASACSAFFYYSKFTSSEHLVLPATGLTNSCYENLFMGNTFLVKAPKVLPAETMKKNCYQNMFGECSSLTGSPILHATTLEENCFSSMFMNCRHLTKAPELPCETLAPWCYSNMFSGCQELVNAPDLPASALTMGCYYQMFSGCFALTQAPVLVAATVPMYGYSGMFRSCRSLNKITCLATDISAMDATNNWLNGVAASGTFTKDVNMASWTTGNSGIPSGWTVVNHGEHDYSQDYLTIEVISGTTNYGLYLGLDRGSESGATIEYSKNGGEWITATFGTSSTVLTNYLPIETGDVFRFRNINSNPSSTNFYNIGCNNYDVNLKVYGNIMSLVDGDNFTTLFALTKSYQFTRLFERNYALRDASNLVLPATLLTSSCYYGLFLGCQQLTAVPVLPATTLAGGCYSTMFQACTGLINAPELPATTLAEGCYRSMFQGCTGLTSAPELPATTLNYSCYYQMFYNCSNLKYVKCLAEENGYGTGGWLENVSPNGTFVKKSGSTWTTGNSGIPSGWVIQEV